MSEREVIAEKLADFVNDNYINSPYSDTGISTDKRYRYVLFSKPCNLDGEIRVYSANYIMIKYQTRYLSLPHVDTRIFTSFENALKFMDLAFVKLEFELALDVPVKK